MLHPVSVSSEGTMVSESGSLGGSSEVGVIEIGAGASRKKIQVV